MALKKNIDIRLKAAESDVYLWQIANALGISDSDFSRQLRTELDPEHKAEILSIIKDISTERGEK